VDDRTLLLRIDRYLDAVPRTVARAEEIGPFTLFVNQGHGWRYYARPSRGADRFTPAAVELVRERQRELAQPEEFEWVADLTAGIARATSAAGLRANDHPLLHLDPDDFSQVDLPPGADLAIATPDDDLATLSAVAKVAFDTPGTSTAPHDPRAVHKAVLDVDADTLAFVRNRMLDGFTVTAVARVDGAPVAVGSHQPLDGATELVGVACLPAHRRRGLGGAVTSLLVEDALDRGVRTIFLSAEDDEIARIYRRLGFRDVGRVGEARPPV
jgi:ribosomal protein S18 acetylase RimI-like enzyme